jgi:hypothetical protein
MAAPPFVGIDFGTCNSSVARFNANTGQAEPLRNAEGDEKTPSVVYFGPRETLVGKHAEERLAHAEGRKYVLTAVKLELARPRVWMLGQRQVNPVEAAAEILKKLKRDAEEGHFLRPVVRAVITCPAVFDEAEKDKVRAAAALAGFNEIELLEEPVAAAVAYAQAGVEVGRVVLVYDLGGGTFDVALLVREDGEETHRLAMEPRGERLGGEDFDRAIYDYFDQRVQEKANRPLCATGIDLAFLQQCRRWKETLSSSEATHPFDWQVPGLGTLSGLRVSRARLERLIESRVDRTIALTQAVRDEAAALGFPVDTVILIGGSSRMPLIVQRLQDTLKIKPHKWEKRDIAVALGAACHAQALWGEKPAVLDRPPSQPPLVLPVKPSVPTLVLSVEPVTEARLLLEQAQAAFDLATSQRKRKVKRLAGALRFADAAADLEPHWTDASDLKVRILHALAAASDGELAAGRGFGRAVSFERAGALEGADSGVKQNGPDSGVKTAAVQATRSVTGRVIVKRQGLARLMVFQISFDGVVLGNARPWNDCDFPFRTTLGEHLLEVVCGPMLTREAHAKSYRLTLGEDRAYRITLTVAMTDNVQRPVRFGDNAEIQYM